MPDKDIWKKFKQGDQVAFETIYRKHVSALYAYGKRFSYDNNLVEDCIQDMFIELWNKRNNIGHTDNIKAYLFVVLRRRIFKMLNKIKVVTLEDDLSKSVFDVELAIDSILEQSEIQNEKSILLQKAFKTLNQKQKEILFLKYHQGIDNREISSILNINYQSVRNAVSRALSKLKDNMLTWMIMVLLIGY